MKSKKGQSISINTIVVAAIALIVLVLIVIIFTSNLTNWREKVGTAQTCSNYGGECVKDANSCPATKSPSGYSCVGDSTNDDEGVDEPVCCI